MEKVLKIKSNRSDPQAIESRAKMLTTERRSDLLGTLCAVQQCLELVNDETPRRPPVLFVDERVARPR